MTDLLDFTRRMGSEAGGTASALEILLRITVLLMAAMLIALALRRTSAALRHMVWTLSLVGTLLIPLCYWAFPAWQWAILPPPPQSLSPSIAPVAKATLPEASLHSAYSPRPSAASVGESFEAPATPPAAAAERPAAPFAPQPTWSWPSLLAAVWATGTFVGLAWLGIGLVSAWHVARHAQSPADSHWREVLQQLLVPCGFRRPIAVRECSQVSVPMTWGVRRPVILVPAGSAAWSEETKRSVLLHELGHIQRGDCLTHLLGRLACVAYWFHPLVWLAARQLRKTSEQAADDVVLSSNIAPPDYAQHLVGIAAQMRGLHLFGHVALPMASPSDLEGRVLAILDPQRNHRSLKRKTCYALMVLAGLILIPCAILRLGYAQEKTSHEPTTAAKNPRQHDTSQTNAAPEVAKQEEAGVASERLEMAEPMLRQGQQRPASPELVKKLLDTNRHWLRPDPQYLSYTFTMEHPGQGDRTQTKVEYSAPYQVTIQTDNLPPYKGLVHDGHDLFLNLFSRADPTGRTALLQGVTLFGPLQEFAMSQGGRELAVLGEETIDGIDAWVLHLKGGGRPDKTTSLLWDADLRQQATRDGRFDADLYKQLKAKSSGPKPLLAMDVGCGVFRTWYGGMNSRNTDVDQFWVDKATCRVLREEGFYNAAPRFVITYSRFEKTADNGQVPRQIVVRLPSSPSRNASDKTYPWVFQMEFQVLEGKVWLLKELKESQGERQNVAIAAVTDASVSAPDKRQTSSQLSGVAGGKVELSRAGEQPAPAATESTSDTASMGVVVVDEVGRPIPGAKFTAIKALPRRLRAIIGDGAAVNVDKADDVVRVSLGEKASDDLLAELRTLQKLRSLHVSSSKQITDSGLAHIGEMSALESLNLYELGVTDDGLKHLAKLANLRELSLAGNRITDAGLARLKDLKNLTKLDISNNQITDAGLVHVAQLTQLRELSLHYYPHATEGDSRITDKGLAELRGLKDLQSLYLDGTGVTSAGLKSLASFPQLESLSLSDVYIGDEGMIHVAGCRNLRRLSLLYTWVHDSGLARLAALKELRQLSLSSLFVTDAGIAAIKALPRLEHLELRASLVTDKALGHVADIKSLTRLDLYGSGKPGVQRGDLFTHAGLAKLKDLPQLRTLWLNNLKLSPGGVAALGEMRQLKELVINFSDITKEQVNQLRQSLPKTNVTATTGADYMQPAKPAAPALLRAFGKVVDPAGKPAAGVEVKWEEDYSSFPRPKSPEITDAAGRFTLPGVEYPTPVIAAVDRQRKLKGHLILTATPQGDVEITLKPTGTLAGRVTDGKKPISGAKVTLLVEVATIRGNTANYDGIENTLTDADGRYRFDLIEAGRKSLVDAEAKGYTRKTSKFGLVVEPGETLELPTLELRPANMSVSGIVVDPQGNPVEGAIVVAQERSSGEEMYSSMPQSTGKDGRFKITDLPDVPLRLMAQMPNNRAERGRSDAAYVPDGAGGWKPRGAYYADAAPGQTDVRIVLDPKLYLREFRNSEEPYRPD